VAEEEEEEVRGHIAIRSRRLGAGVGAARKRKARRTNLAGAAVAKHHDLERVLFVAAPSCTI
jgi:hypothetical protein